MKALKTSKRIIRRKQIAEKLNIGCGKYKLEGYHNIDSWDDANPDQFVNLENLPLPFKTDYFSEVRAHHVLEHLNNPFGIMLELHRVCRHGAVIKIKVPHFSRGMTHADHKRCFDITFPFYFKPDFGSGYLGKEMELSYQKLRWFGQPYMKKLEMPLPMYLIGRTLGALIDLMANLSPIFCSRIWCFWVGGFEEYEMHFKVIK